MSLLLHKIMFLSLFFRGELPSSSHNVNYPHANGENLLIFLQVPSQRIVLKWRCRNWPYGESFRGPVIKATLYREKEQMWQLTALLTGSSL